MDHVSRMTHSADRADMAGLNTDPVMPARGRTSACRWFHATPRALSRGRPGAFGRGCHCSHDVRWWLHREGIRRSLDFPAGPSQG